MKARRVIVIITCILLPAMAKATPFVSWDASQDGTRNKQWEASGGTGTASWSLSRIAGPIDVSSEATKLTKAYDFAGGLVGNGGNFQNVFSSDPTRDSVSFELWLKPDSLTSGSQVLFEVGGKGNGLSLTLSDDDLLFRVKSGGKSLSVTDTDTLTRSVADDFFQLVGVYAAGQTDSISLFLNGALLGSASGRGINDWAGPNKAGLGGKKGDVGGDLGDLGAYGGFQGQIALINMYRSALTPEEVAAAYNLYALPEPGTSGAVPEPGTLALLALGVAGFARRFRS